MLDLSTKQKVTSVKKIPVVEFTLCNSNFYKAHVDYQGRIRTAEWFNQQKPKVGDIISLWRYGESNEYTIQTLKKEPY